MNKETLDLAKAINLLSRVVSEINDDEADARNLKEEIQQFLNENPFEVKAEVSFR